MNTPNSTTNDDNPQVTNHAQQNFDDLKEGLDKAAQALGVLHNKGLLSRDRMNHYIEFLIVIAKNNQVSTTYLKSKTNYKLTDTVW